MDCLRKSLKLFHLTFLFTTLATKLNLFTLLLANNVRLYLHFQVRVGCFETRMSLRGCGVVNGMLAHVYYGCVTSHTNQTSDCGKENWNVNLQPFEQQNKKEFQ